MSFAPTPSLNSNVCLFDCLQVILEDVNECEEHDNMCKNGHCTNTFGSYMCSCNEGYRLDNTSTFCYGNVRNTSGRTSCTRAITIRVYRIFLLFFFVCIFLHTCRCRRVQRDAGHLRRRVLYQRSGHLPLRLSGRIHAAAQRKYVSASFYTHHIIIVVTARISTYLCYRYMSLLILNICWKLKIYKRFN